MSTFLALAGLALIYVLATAIRRHRRRTELHVLTPSEVEAALRPRAEIECAPQHPPVHSVNGNER